MGAGEAHVETVVAAHHGMLVAVGSVLSTPLCLQHEVAVENDINIGMRNIALDVIVMISCNSWRNPCTTRKNTPQHFPAWRP